MSATTVADLIGQTRREVMGMSRGSYNKLDSGLDETATSVIATFPLEQSLAKGSFLAVDDEIMYVYATDDPSKTMTVERGDLGTIRAVHTAGARIECNPRFPKPVIRDALQEEIASWPTTLFATDRATLSVGTNRLDVDSGLPSNFIDILEVNRRPTTTSSQQQLNSYNTSWPQVGYRYERGMPTSDYASGTALFLNSAAMGGYAISVVFAKPFDLTSFDDAVDLIADVGLERSMIDIPKVGAAARLLAGREVSRTAMEAQGEARAATEVPVGATLRSASGLRALRDARLVEEGNRLLDRYGWRRTA